MNPFHQLKRGNDWGAIYFSHAPLTGVGFASTSRGWKFKYGQPRSVKFPDGSDGVIVIRTEKRARSASDHGHTSHWLDDHPMGSLSIHGLIATFELDTAGLLIERRPDYGDP